MLYAKERTNTAMTIKMVEDNELKSEVTLFLLFDVFIVFVIDSWIMIIYLVIVSYKYTI
jgi:hypothetical protein